MEKFGPESIRSLYQEGKVNEKDAVKYFTSVIEHSRDARLRLSAVRCLTNSGIKSDFMYEFFEHLLVSDEQREIRTIAGFYIIKSFLERGHSLLQWVIQHEQSASCLISLLKTLLREKQHPTIVESLKNDYESRFSFHLQRLGVDRKESMMIALLERYEIEMNPVPCKLRTNYVDFEFNNMILCQDVCIVTDKQGHLRKMFLNPAGHTIIWIRTDPWVLKCFPRLETIIIPKNCRIPVQELAIPAELQVKSC